MKITLPILLASAASAAYTPAHSFSFKHDHSGTVDHPHPTFSRLSEGSYKHHHSGPSDHPHPRHTVLPRSEGSFKHHHSETGDHPHPTFSRFSEHPYKHHHSGTGHHPHPTFPALATRSEKNHNHTREHHHSHGTGARSVTGYSAPVSVSYITVMTTVTASSACPWTDSTAAGIAFPSSSSTISIAAFTSFSLSTDVASSVVASSLPIAVVSSVSGETDDSCAPATVNVTTTATVTVYGTISTALVVPYPASATLSSISTVLSSSAAISTGASLGAFTLESNSTFATVTREISTSSSSTSTPTPSAVSTTIVTNSSSSLAVSAQYKADALSIITTLAETYNNKTKVWSNLWGYQAATIYQDLMDFDYWTGTTTQKPYLDALVDIVTEKSYFDGVGASDDYNDDREWWILAFIHGYRKYGNIALLTKAEDMFNQIVASSQLSASDAGTTPELGGVARSDQIPKDCDVAGSVYWKQSASSSINAVSTGLVGHIGALLYAITKEENYRTAADLAINYERRKFLSSTGIMIVDSITTATCHFNGGNLCYNTGIYLAALTSLYQTTGEAQYLEWATLSATTSISGYFGTSASQPLVITSGGGHDVFFRCLNEFWALLKTENINPELQSQIQNFVKVNADYILARAKSGGDYSKTWLNAASSNQWDFAGSLGAVMGAMIMA